MSLHLYLGRVAVDGAITALSHDLYSPLAHFTSADIGRQIDVLGADAGGATLTTTIAAVSGDTATLGLVSRATLTLATLTVYIPYNAALGSINYNNSLTSRDTLAFSGDRTNNPVAPVMGQPVLLVDTILGDLFGGSIDDVKLSNVGGGFTAFHECQCVSWDALASKRGTGQPNDGVDPLNGKFSGMAAGAVFQWIAEHCLDSDISTVSVVTGPTIPEISFDFTDVASAFNSICQAASDDTDTYIWRTDARRNLFFELQTTTPAPWNISNSDVLVQYSFTRTRVKYANMATVTPKNSSGDTIDSTLVVTVQNNPAIDERSGVEGGTGKYEVIVAAGDRNSAMDATTLATSIAESYGNVPNIVEYSTRRGGLRAGQLQTISLTELGISGSFLIDSVSLTTAAGDSLWQIHAVAGALIGDWRSAFAGMSGGGSGISGVGGGGGGAGGGSVMLDVSVSSTTVIARTPADGTLLTVRITQDGTGHPVTWSSDFVFPPEIENAPSLTSLVMFAGFSGKWYLSAAPILNVHV